MEIACHVNKLFLIAKAVLHMDVTPAEQDINWITPQEYALLQTVMSTRLLIALHAEGDTHIQTIAV